MKGYEWLNLVLVILFCFIPVFLEASSKIHLRLNSYPGMTTSCTQEPSTIWLRNACHGGFVTLTKGRKKTKVIAQHKGIHQKSPKVELIKESCHDESAGFLGSVTTRLYSPHADKYICFNHRGKVTAKSRKSIERMGPLCMFLERATSVGSRNFVQFQSSYNPEWYFGFDGKRVVHRKKKTRHTAHTLPRKMKRTRIHRKRRHKCDFSFSTGSFRSLENEFSGLIEHIRKQKLLKIHNNKNNNNDKDFESSLIPESQNGGNDIFVSRVSKTPAYYYIESNDERYKPEEVRRRTLQDEDEEDLLESKISFLNFKSNLKMYQLAKKQHKSVVISSSSSSSSSSSNPSSSSSKNNKKRKKKKLKRRRQKNKNVNLVVVRSPSSSSSSSLPPSSSASSNPSQTT